MLPRTWFGVPAALAVFTLAGVVVTPVVAGRHGNGRESTPLLSIGGQRKTAEISGTITRLDAKDRTVVITQHSDGGQRDKVIELSWGKKLKPKQAGKEVEWRAVRPGILATAKYQPGKGQNTLVELNVAK